MHRQLLLGVICIIIGVTTAEQANVTIIVTTANCNFAGTDAYVRVRLCHRNAKEDNIVYDRHCSKLYKIDSSSYGLDKGQTNIYSWSNFEMKNVGLEWNSIVILYEPHGSGSEWAPASFDITVNDRNETITVKRDDGWSCDPTAWVDQEGYYVFGPANNNGVEPIYLGVDL